MSLKRHQTVDDIINELNEEPNASFSELANQFDIWASRADSTRGKMIEYVGRQTRREYEQKEDSQPISSGEFVVFPVVIFSPQGSE